MMKRLVLCLAAALTTLSLFAPQAGAFGLDDFKMAFTDKDGLPETQAGAHPYAFSTSFDVETFKKGGGTFAVEAVKDLRLDAPPGLVAKTDAVPPCSTIDFLTQVLDEANGAECADSSVLGKTGVEIGEVGEKATSDAPVYSLVPPPGAVAKIGFWILGVPITVDLGLSETPPYNGIATVKNISQVIEFFGSQTTLWGVPASPAHDEERGRCLAAGGYEGPCPAGVGEVPFVISPRACEGPLPASWTIDTWQHPDTLLAGFSLTEALTGCGSLGFSAGISARPTTKAAQSATGLDFGLDVQDEGLASPKAGAIAGSDIRKAIVTLPRGMTINPSQAEGLEVCSEAELAREHSDSAPGEGCPEASKIGTIEVETPLLPENRVLKGSLFVATPYENPFDSLIAFYIVIKDPELGVLVTQAARVEPDPVSGQLITTTEDMPQLPFSHFRLHFREGGRSPLISPPGCGTFNAEAELFPWSGGAPVTSTSAFQIIAGPNEGPCLQGAAPFHPGFEAGTVNNAAKAFSPFDMRLTRKDGEQDMTKFSAILPPGVAGILAGLTHCSEASIAAARARTGPHGGREELDAPSCPASSRIGGTIAGAGVGSQLVYVPGSLYLAGPLGGDPLSVVSITPAVAGPFDAGVVVVRVALTLNPITGEVEADGSRSDPIPHILKGIPLNVRDLRVNADRPKFTFNATNCDPLQARATLWGGGTALAPLPEAPITLNTRYRAAGCASLGFKPKLAIKLRGGTRRGDHPALRTIVTPRPQDANFAGAVVTLPHSAFLDQAHIRTICTRVQFAAGGGNGERCPAGSIYGKAKAWTPILDRPAQGPVFLRSSNHNLPDLVIALQGPPEAAAKVEISARIDSIHGGIRASFEKIPDFPVSRFLLDMRGAKKGLIINSTNLCLSTHRINAELRGQNGRLDHTHPALRAPGCGKQRKRR